MNIVDTRLPYLETALTRQTMRELVAEQVVPRLLPGRTLAKLSLQYSRYKAGKEHVALYQLELDPEPDTAPPLLTVTFGQRGRLQRIHEQISSGDAARARSALLLAEQSCLAEIFPADFGLPLLWQAADADRATELVGAMLPDCRDVRIARVDLLRYRPGRRCVLRYEIEHHGGRLVLVGKLYAEGKRATIVATKAQTLSGQAAATIKLATPVGLAPSNGLLLMEHIDGDKLGDQLENSPSREINEQTVRTAAFALATFHRFRLETSESRSLRSEVDGLRARLEPVHDVGTSLAHDIQALLAEIETHLAALPPTTECVIHGEYKPNQLLLRNGQISVVDLDRSCIGDPAIDVGNFCAVLEKEVFYEGHPHLAGLSDVFLSAYDTANHIDGIGRRAAIFRSLTFLRMLTRYFERNPQGYARLGGEWRPLVFLAEARSSIDRL